MSRGLDDFLILEERLVKRIEQQVPELVNHVRMVNRIEDIVQRAAPITLWIMPGVTAIEADRSGRAFDCNQRWSLLLVVRNASQGLDKRPARIQAGPIISRLFDTLAGWHPGAPFGILRPVTAPSPFFEPGLFFYPMEFETHFAFQAATPLERTP